MGVRSMSRVLHPHSSTKTVTTPGTAVPLAAVSTPVSMLFVRALPTNTGSVFVGDSLVDRTTSKQIELAPGDSVSLDAPIGDRLDAADHYLDADVAAEGVTVLMYW